MDKPRAVVLLSGGVDSTTTSAIALADGFEVYAQTFEYGQRHRIKAAVEGGHPLTIHTPLIRLTKAEIIRRGLDLGVDYGLTISCYDPSPAGVACGACDSCLLRLKGFRANGIADPIPYRVDVKS